MAVETLEDVEVAEIPEVSLNSSLVDKGDSVFDIIKSSSAFKELNATMAVDVDANFVSLANELQSNFDALAEKQGANQGGNVTFKQKGSDVILLIDGKEVLAGGGNDGNNGTERLVKTLMNEALKSLPGREAGTRKKRSIGGNEVKPGKFD